jgi:uncharacterized small protein (DUF1192 family)
MLAWLSYGHAARRSIAISYLQLDSERRPAPVAHSAPDTTGPTAHTAHSPDQQRLKSISLDLYSVRLSVDRIALAQEEIMRKVGQFAADEEQMTGEISKLLEVERQILHKNSEPQPGTAPALARTPAPRWPVPVH